MTATRVQDFLAEIGVQRPGPAASGNGSSDQPLLPVALHLEHGHKEAREHVLWRLGDPNATPAAMARSFAQQHVQQPHQLEHQAMRLAKELEKVLEQHRDLSTAPRSPTLVKLEVRCALPHLGVLFCDEPLWDLGAPRAACEAYISQVCNDLGLDWHAHTLIMRRFKDAIDAAAKDYAEGRAQVVPCPTGAALRGSAPGRFPQVMRPSKQQVEAARDKHKAAQQGQQGQVQQPGAATGAAAAAAADGCSVKQEGGNTSGGQQAGPAVSEAPGEVAAAQEGSDDDMPDLPFDDS